MRILKHENQTKRLPAESRLEACPEVVMMVLLFHYLWICVVLLLHGYGPGHLVLGLLRPNLYDMHTPSTYWPKHGRERGSEQWTNAHLFLECS